VFRIDGNTFYDRKNKILMKISEFKRSGIGLITEFRGILNRFPNQARQDPTRGCINFPLIWSTAGDRVQQVVGSYLLN
jgi:hypothetical protein